MPVEKKPYSSGQGKDVTDVTDSVSKGPVLIWPPKLAHHEYGRMYMKTKQKNSRICPEKKCEHEFLGARFGLLFHEIPETLEHYRYCIGVEKIETSRVVDD